MPTITINDPAGGPARSVTVNGNPTPDDIEEIGRQLFPQAAKSATSQPIQLHGNTVGEQIADAYQQFTHPKPAPKYATVPPRNIDPTVPGTPAYAASHTPAHPKPTPTDPATAAIIGKLSSATGSNQGGVIHPQPTFGKSTRVLDPTGITSLDEYLFPGDEQPKNQQQGLNTLEPGSAVDKFNQSTAQDFAGLVYGLPKMLYHSAAAAGDKAAALSMVGMNQAAGYNKAADAQAQTLLDMFYGSVPAAPIVNIVADRLAGIPGQTLPQAVQSMKEGYATHPLVSIVRDLGPFAGAAEAGVGDVVGAIGNVGDTAAASALDFTPEQAADLSRYAGVQDRPAPAAAPPDGATPAPSGNVPTPFAAIEARPSETLANALATRPQAEQLALRNDLVRELQGYGPEGTIALYQAMGIPHTVFAGRGSFEGTITPNYNVLLHSGDMAQARLVAAIEGIGNVQDAAAIIRVDPDAASSIPSVRIARVDGAPMTDAEIGGLYDHVNRNAKANGRLEFSELPNNGLIFGNYGGLPAEDFAAAFEGIDPRRYNTQAVFNDGDYIQGYNHGSSEAYSANEPSGYGSTIRAARDTNGATGRPDLSNGIDRYFTAPRLRAYTGAAQRAGIDPGPIQRQILEAGEHVKRALGPPDNGNPPQGPPSGGPSGFAPPAAGGTTANPAAPLPPQPPGAPGPSAPAGSAMRVVMPGLLPRGPALSSAFNAFGRPVAGGYASNRSLPFGASPDDYDVPGLVAHVWGLDGRRYVFRAPDAKQMAARQAGAPLGNSGDRVVTTPEGRQYVFRARSDSRTS